MAAGAQRSQVRIRVNSRAVAVLPTKFDGIVTDRADLLQPGPGDRNKIYLRPVSLTQGARTVSAQIFFGVLSDVTVIPGDPDEAVRFDMINFSWIPRFHNVIILRGLLRRL